MEFKIKSVYIILILAFFNSCKIERASVGERKETHPTNIILLIGDGMGVAQISTLYFFNETGRAPGFSRFSNIGLHKNTSYDGLITDSAAGATAFSCGLKTYNAAIGVDKDTVPHISIFDYAKMGGYKTGITATSSITHATPASFYAHVAHRDMEEAIALQLPKFGLDFFAAGGLKYFKYRTDGQNLLLQLEQEGYYVDTLGLPTELKDGAKYACLADTVGLPKILDGRGSFFSEATQLAISHLKQGNSGFILMAEGSQIDWAGHRNDSAYLLSEMQDFNEAVHAALDFAEKDGNTLVIVTADHETGGLALAGSDPKSKGYSKLDIRFSTPQHTAALVPVFAYGPHSELFQGVYDNTEIFNKMLFVLEKK